MHDARHGASGHRCNGKYQTLPPSSAESIDRIDHECGEEMEVLLTFAHTAVHIHDMHIDVASSGISSAD